MDDLRCPFSTVLLEKAADCQYAQEVVRRGGYEIACQNATINKQCQALADKLRDGVLPLLGYENDLLTVPHSMLQKLQFGSVLTLTKTVQANSAVNVGELSQLPEKLLAVIKNYDNLPYSDIATAVEQIKLKKRRAKK